MMSALRLNLMSHCQRSCLQAFTCSVRSQQPKRCYARWEPDDIQYEPEIPEYEEIVVKMRGYNYVILESFLKYVHSIALGFQFDVEGYPAPAHTTNIKTFKPLSTNIENEYDLSLYERTVKISDLQNTLLPLFMEAVQQNTPEGVSVSVKIPDPEEEEFRFVPDVMVIQLQEHLDKLDQVQEERRK